MTIQETTLDTAVAASLNALPLHVVCLQDEQFSLYNLQPECEYAVSVQPVSHTGRKGPPVVTSFQTLPCRLIAARDDQQPRCEGRDICFTISRNLLDSCSDDGYPLLFLAPVISGTFSHFVQYRGQRNHS